MLFDGLSPIVCGVLGYVSIILYDLNNTSHNNDRMQSLHTVGAGLIGLAFFSTVLPGLSEANSLPAAVRIIAGVLALGFFALLIYLHPHRKAGARTGSARTKKRWWEKDLVTTGPTLSAAIRVFGRCSFSVCCSFRRRTLIRGAPPLSAYAVCCWQCMRTSMFSQCSCAGTTPTRDTTPFLFPTKESIRRCFNGKKAK